MVRTIGAGELAAGKRERQTAYCRPYRWISVGWMQGAAGNSPDVS